MVVDPFDAARQASEKSVADQWLDFLRHDPARYCARVTL
jgi:hypothetical protein